MDKLFKFAIVGGGLTATSMLCQFVEKASIVVSAGKLDPSVILLSIFEKTDEFGPGFPHNHKHLLPFHITNMCAGDMGVYADRLGDFQAWIDQNIDWLRVRFADYPAEVFELAQGPCNHYPRAFMGAYLQARFHQAVKAARKLGIAVKLYPRHEITDIRLVGGMARLEINRPHSGGWTKMVADAVLLATGHWFPDSRQKNYFDSPWPAKKLLERIPPGVELAVIGTSLSAIETVLTLTSDGRFVSDSSCRLSYIPSNKPRRIKLYSRSGLLPKVRGKVGAHVNKFINPLAMEKIRSQNNGRISLNATFDLLNAELEMLYGRSIDWLNVLEPKACPANELNHYLKEAEIGDGPQGVVLWQTVLQQTFPYIREWYLQLTDQDRKRFDRGYTSAFFANAASQPRINAAKLLALMGAGFVSIVRLGKHYRFYRDNDQDRYCFDYTDRYGNKRLDTYRYVVNARGQPKSLTTATSELAQNLLASINTQIVKESADRTAFLRKHTAIGDYNITSDKSRYATIRVDPRTHRVVLPDFGSAIYAVGAMTRSQIIDTSMAHGISCSTATVADNLLRIVLRRI